MNYYEQSSEVRFNEKIFMSNLCMCKMHDSLRGMGMDWSTQMIKYMKISINDFSLLFILFNAHLIYLIHSPRAS